MSGDLMATILSASAKMPMRVLEVPEWGVTLYWRSPSLSVRAAIQDRAGSNPATKDARACALTLLLIAKREDGSPAFADTGENFALLMNMEHGDVAARVAGELISSEVADEAKKPSAEEPAS